MWKMITYKHMIQMIKWTKSYEMNILFAWSFVKKNAEQPQ